jgi:hypothetical protein
VGGGGLREKAPSQRQEHTNQNSHKESFSNFHNRNVKNASNVVSVDKQTSSDADGKKGNCCYVLERNLVAFIRIKSSGLGGGLSVRAS